MVRLYRFSLVELPENPRVSRTFQQLVRSSNRRCFSHRSELVTINQAYISRLL